MRACIHLVLRDMRRIALLLIAVVLVDIFALVAVQEGLLDQAWVVWVGRFIMFVIGADVILSDPASGTRAQWRTRPVSGRSMAVGKTAVLTIVALGAGVAVLAGQSITGTGMWPGIYLGLWEVFRAALWVMLGAALAVLVDSAGKFALQAALTLIVSAFSVGILMLLAEYSEWIAAFVVRGAREHGRAILLAGSLSMVFAFAAVARRYMRPHRIWFARMLAWLACLFVLGHEGLRLLVG